MKELHIYKEAPDNDKFAQYAMQLQHSISQVIKITSSLKLKYLWF
jgi:hypothetical protein